MKIIGSRHIFFAVIGLLFCAKLLTPHTAAAELQQSQRSGTEMRASFQYLLANFSGSVPSQWARLNFDPQQQEIYTLTQGFNEVRIFNLQGMEIYAFGGAGGIVSAVDIVSGDDGSIYILARDFRKNAIQALNFRGELEAVITIKDLPQQFVGFSPDRMEYQDGQFYLLDSRALQIVIIANDGSFIRGHDLSSKFDLMAEEQDPEKKKSLALDISGFSLGPDGSIYFTAPTLFSAFRLNLDGTLDIFGTSGSGTGKFGVVSGIAADNRGNIYVADRLRSVVMIFSADFVFMGEFGYRGDRPEDMIVPDDLAIDRAGNRVFVSQAANKGVGVYKITLLQTP